MDQLCPERFLRSLHRLREFGASGVGKGVIRPAFSSADVAARLWLMEAFAEAGLDPHMDAAGNVFGLSAAENSSLVGSHSDSQPEGGWLDGALGVMAGLEIARAAIATDGRPVSVVSFQDEEGRFGGLGGSEIWAGRTTLAQADSRKDKDGITFAEARSSIKAHVTGPVDPARFAGFLEMHIEQGPELEIAGNRIGVVSDIVGFRQLDITLIGRQNHAGTTRMTSRRDAVQGMMRLNETLNQKLGAIASPATVWTIGRIDVRPNAASIVPGAVSFSFQWRDAAAARLDQMETLVRDELERLGKQYKLLVQIDGFTEIPPVPTNKDLRGRLAAAAQTISPGTWCDMPSGALHDASNVADLMPMAMLFVPSIGGISHAFDEDTAEDDLVQGLHVLAAATQMK